MHNKQLSYYAGTILDGRNELTLHSHLFNVQTTLEAVYSCLYIVILIVVPWFSLVVKLNKVPQHVAKAKTYTKKQQFRNFIISFSDEVEDSEIYYAKWNNNCKEFKKSVNKNCFGNSVILPTCSSGQDRAALSPRSSKLVYCRDSQNTAVGPSESAISWLDERNN